MLSSITLLKVCNQMSSIITTIILIGVLSQDIYGTYATISSVLLISLNSYVSGAAIAEGGRTSSQKNRINQANGVQFLRYALLSLPIICVEILLLTAMFPASIEGIAPKVILTLYFISENLRFMFSGYFRGIGKNIYGAALLTTPGIVLCIMVFFARNYITDISQIFLLKLISSLPILTWVMFLHKVKLNNFGEISLSKLASQFWEGVTIGFASATNQINKNIGILLISYIVGMSAVADFKMSTLVAFPMTVPAFLMTSVLIKSIKNASENGQQTQYLINCRRIQRLNIYIFIPNLIVVVMFNKLLPLLTTNENYQINTVIAAAEVLTLFVQNAFGPTNLLLHLQDQSWRVVKITVLGILLNLSLSLLLIPEIGLIGVIFGAFISRTVMQLMGRRANNKINVVKNGSIERIFDR